MQDEEIQKVSCIAVGPKAISGKAAAFLVFLVILQTTAMQIFIL